MTKSHLLTPFLTAAKGGNVESVNAPTLDTIHLTVARDNLTCARHKDEEGVAPLSSIEAAEALKL
jgi:hypothetical protein